MVKAFVTGWSALLEVVENTFKAYYWDRLAGMVMVVKSLRATGVFRRALLYVMRVCHCYLLVD